jgi:hypothetical protein
MGSGNPEPYINCWADSEDATLFGAWGPIDKGYRRLAKTFRWVGSRFKSGRLVPEHTVVFSSGTLLIPSVSSAERWPWMTVLHGQ